jgi:integrase
MAPRRRRFGRLRRLPSGRWQARYPGPDGRDYPASETFATKTDADRWLAMVEADMLRGEWVDPRSGETIFSEWVDQWLRSNPTKRPTTLARDESVLRTHFLPLLGPRPLASITRLDVRRTVDVMTARVSPATARTNYGVLSAVLNAAVEADMIARSPCRGIVLATAPRRERPTLSPEELARLAAELPERYRPTVYLAGVLGLRWSEIVGLRVRRVNFLDRTLTVSETVSEVGGKLLVGADTKSSASQRTIAVPPFMLEMLAAHLARRERPGPDEFVFLGPKGGLLRRSFEARHFLPAAKRAGLDGLSFHGLRHAAASLLIESGEHPRVVQHRLGHATARLSMELYSHVSNASDRAVAVRLEERFSNQSGTQRARGGSDDLK